MTIYGNAISGNCHKVKFVCDRLGIPYRWVEVDLSKGETRTSAFLAMNPAGQVPTVMFDDGRPLAQSNAIMQYLAEGSDLIPTDAFDRALMNQWLFWEQYSHETAIAVRRYYAHILKKPDGEIDPSLIEKGKRALGVMEGHLAARQYFVGEKLTLADLALVAYTRLSHEAGFDLAEFPAVKDWVRRIERDLGLNS
ncbi:glutathione S-transferase family protein [Parvibaculum sp.]|uniref:glutathione S-transferase family protein n=1 Tax=Parvibaculum sp. TaxID=2024848 RepID=UPI00320CD71B